MILLPSAEQVKSFPTSSDLLLRLQQAKMGQVIYPQPQLPAHFKLESILKEPPRTLSNGSITYSLTNGILFTWVPTSEKANISLQIRPNENAQIDPPGKEGLVALASYNFFRATSSISQQAVSEQMRSLSAQYYPIFALSPYHNILSQFEPPHTAIKISAPSSNFVPALQLLLHIAQNLKLEPKDISISTSFPDNLRNAIIGDFSKLSYLGSLYSLYPNALTLRPHYGNSQTLATISPQDVLAYTKIFFNTKGLKVAMAGRLNSEEELNRVLFAFSQLKENSNSNDEIKKEKTKANIAQRYDFPIAAIKDSTLLKKLGTNIFPQIKVTHTPKEISIAYVTIRFPMALPTSVEMPYSYAFFKLFSTRVFQRVVNGKKYGRLLTTDKHLYSLPVQLDVVENDKPASAYFSFYCEPDKIRDILLIFQEEYMNLMTGEYKATQQELASNILKSETLYYHINRTLSEKTESANFRAVQAEQRPWLFREQDGTITKVVDAKEFFRRTALLPINDVIRIAGQYFNNQHPKVLHIVGPLP